LLLVCQWTGGGTVLRHWLPTCCNRKRITERCDVVPLYQHRIEQKR